MGRMTFADYVRLFEQKAEPFTDDETFTTLFDSAHGFLQYKIDENNRLHIGCCCGDLNWVHKLCELKAKLYKCKEMYMFTCRNPKAWLRRGYQLGYLLHLDTSRCGYYKGRYYFCISEVVLDEF